MLIGLIGSFILPTATFTQVATQANPEPSNQPNIIFILADDLGWADVGYNAEGHFETPHIDQMKSEGAYFSQAYANAPVCAPSRACLLTGLYPPRHEIYNVNKSHAGPPYSWPLHTAPRNEDLDTSFFTLAEALQAEGYATGFIGKWHLWEDHPAFHPGNQGFDKVFGGDPNGKVKSHFPPYGPPSLPKGTDNPYLADLLTSQAIDFIKDHDQSDDQPFFLLLSHYAVHDPIEAKSADIEPFRTSFTPGDSTYFNPVYAAMVKNLDDNIGRMLQFLEREGHAEHTIIVFFSDNGGSLAYTSNAPLRSGKGTLYEGGIRVPLIFYSKGDWIDRGEHNIPVHSLDLYPTLLTMAGARNFPNTDGHDLSGIIQNEEAGTLDRSIFWVYPAQKRFKVRHQPAKVFDRTTFPAAVIRKGDFKLIHYFGILPDELFNLNRDVDESQDLADSEPERRAEMLSVLKEWLDQTQAFIPTDNPQFDAKRSTKEGLWKK